MPKPREDRRVIHTKSVLKSSLLELLREKPIKRITVTDICRRADINRGTFYAHYMDPEDLLHQIEENLKNTLLAVFEADRLENILPALSEVVKREEDFCRVLFNGHVDESFMREMIALIQTRVVEKWSKRYPHLNRARLEVLFAFCFSGYTALLREWLTAEQGLAHDQLEDVAKQLVAACVAHMATEAAGTPDE